MGWSMGLRSPLLHTLGDDFGWSLLDASPNATLIVAGSGEIAYVSERAAVLFGWSMEDLLGQSVEVLVPDDAMAVHRAHRTRYRAAPAVRAMGEGMELRGRRRDGSLFPIEISLSPVQFGEDMFTVAAMRDITERVDAEEHAHRVLRTLDASADAMFIFDAATLRYSFVNEGVVRMVGYEREELLGMTPMHLNAAADEAEYRGIVEQLLTDTTRPLVRHSTLLGKDGREVPVEKTFTSAPTGRDGTQWVIVIARDESERMAATEELRASQAALQAAERATAVSEDRERIARDLHDTVIQRLFGEAMHLQATLGLVDEPVRARLESTISGLDETIRELRTSIFLLQSAQQRPGGRRGILLEEVIGAGQALGFEPRLQFEGPIESIPDPIFEHLVPVLREALSNVARHAGAQAVRVAVAVGDDVVLTVSDDGSGPPAEVLGGHGLNNIAARAAALGGTSSFEPRAPTGAVVTWRVPLPDA